MNIQSIPLSKLIPSPENVRKTGPMIGIAELAAQIKTHGLLQNLTVRAGDAGKFEVIAGRRRLAALKRLARNRDIERLVEIPCNIIDDADPTEISLVENVGQLPMHPADQFEAFRDLTEKGSGPEEIAARFGCSPLIVRQRLKLASVSPRLVKTYRAGKMTLDQLMAFTVSDDHAAQEAAWFRQPEWNRDPATLRRALTRAHVEASDRRARFVGIEAYVGAGGTVLRDLFATEHDGYLTDPALLDRLVAERLEREAEAILAEGWKWVTVAPDLGYADLRGFGRVHPHLPPWQSEAETDETERTPVWDAEDVARAGAIVGIGHDGDLSVHRGFVRPEDAIPDGEPSNARDPRRKSGRGESGDLSAALVQDLTAQRTAALRAMLAEDHNIALAAVVHAMTLPLFYDRYGTGSCLSLRIDHADLEPSIRDPEHAPAMRALAEHEEVWRQRLPETGEELWAWCLAQDAETRLALLSFCAACSIDAVQRPHERREERHAHAGQLADALSLDMRKWWQPTPENYLARVSKQRVLEAVAEGVSLQAADNLCKLKKDALISHAHDRLSGSGWLPALLRRPAADTGDEQPLAAD